MCAGDIWAESNHQGGSRWGDEPYSEDSEHDQAVLGDVERGAKPEQTSWGGEMSSDGWGHEEASLGDVGRGALPEQTNWGDEQSSPGWGSQHANLDGVARGATPAQASCAVSHLHLVSSRCLAMG